MGFWLKMRPTQSTQAVPEAGQQMLWVLTLNIHASWGGLYLQNSVIAEVQNILRKTAKDT